MEEKLNIILSPKKLRHYRKIADKRQFQVADILGVDRTTYNGYEKKESLEVPTEKGKAIADFLGVTVFELQKDEKVEKVEPLNKHLVFDGEYIGLHKKAWEEFQKTLAHSRDTLTDITKNNSELTQNNSRLTESITDLVKNLLWRGNQ